MAEKEETLLEVHITDNVLTKGKFLRIPWRNWLEGLIMFLTLKGILMMMNLTPWARHVFTGILGGALGAFGVHGIDHRSVIQYITAKIKFKNNRRKLHLRSPEYVKKITELKSMEGNNSYGAEILYKTKQWLLEFARNNSEE